MTRRFRMTPRAIANLTGLPLSDVLDMMESGHRFGPLRSDLRHPWDPRQVHVSPGVRHDTGYSLSPDDDTDDDR